MQKQVYPIYNEGLPGSDHKPNVPFFYYHYPNITETEVKLFNHPQSGKIRSFDIDDEPCLVVKDVVSALGYENTQ